ncbi:MAG: flagellar basal body rod protein FlgC [Acidobacteria bacterium]|nr:flagellar basal body rod protein FlgC [Acidobacteriota bacterium]
MSLLTAIAVSASGLSAQRRRLEVLVSNLANANTTQPAGVEPYRRKDVVFSSVAPATSFGAEFENAVRGVEISGIVTDHRSELRKVSDPGHPHADSEGYVYYPNVKPMEELVNVLSATRSYEANLKAVNSAKEMAMKTLEILQ